MEPVTLLTDTHKQITNICQPIDEEEDSSYLMYLDANNLYGWAMSQPLPNGEFKWVEDPDNINIDDYLDDEGRGMVLEVDTEYPEELHDLHNGYPLAPESKEIKSEMLSDYATEIAEKYNISVGGIRKLITSSRPRKKYVDETNEGTQSSHIQAIKMVSRLHCLQY